MSMALIAAALLGVTPVEAGTPQSVAPPAQVEQEPLVPPRVGIELRDATRAALRRWARPSDKEADLAARELLVLYKELQQDDEMARSVREPLRNKVRGRLQKLSQQIKKRTAIRKRLAKSKRPKSVANTGQDVLCQWGGFGGQGFGGQGFGGGAGGPMMGGMGFGAPGQKRKDDYGEDLVELIQATIAPQTWDVNGGPGTIYYWRPGRSIVVRQMGEVHDNIGGLLEQLHRAGQ